MAFEVYCITNNINGKQYVGVTTKGYGNRFANHVWHSRKERKSCRALYAAMNKYGADSFSVDLLDTAESFEYMNSLEKHYISVKNTMYPNGYNLTTGGDSGSMSRDTLRIMSERLKGKPMSAKNKDGLKKAWANQEIRDRRCKAIREAMSRPEVREKTGERQRGKKKSESHVKALRAARATPVVCKETGDVFDAVCDAAGWIRSQGLYPKASHTKISRAISREDYTAYGYHWSRYDAG